jgi:NAD(P)-dependent dehydrogenase (short-subunit alcohol dehydrogenase family)
VPLINDFERNHRNSYLNFYCLCFFPAIRADDKGTQHKVYSYSNQMTPYDKLKSFPRAKQYLNSGLTFATLDQVALQLSENQAADQLQGPRQNLFATSHGRNLAASRNRRETMPTASPRVAVVTGASSGIGLEAAKALAAQGWRVIATGRNRARSAAAETAIRAVSSSGQVDMLLADLALLADAAQLAQDIAVLTDRIDVLVNNAGGMASEKVITSEGFEANFAGNHLGPFLLTQRLLPLLRHAAAAAPAGSVRIINTSSDGSEMIPGLNLDDLQTFEKYSNGLAYCSGKLANVLFARALALRLKNDGIIAHSFHPGTVASNFFSHTDADVQARYSNVNEEGLTPAQGADTLIWLATAAEPGASSGGYFCQRAPRIANPLVDDEAYIDRFWAVSEALVAKAGV